MNLKFSRPSSALKKKKVETHDEPVIESTDQSHDHMELRDFSILCMTKDRPNEFARVFNYWRQFPVEFIVSDGSELDLTEIFISNEMDGHAKHKNFTLKYQRELDFSSRFRWMSLELSRKYAAFNNDDDFLFAPNVKKVLQVLNLNPQIAGIYSWRNFSREFISGKRQSLVSSSISKSEVRSRLLGALDSSRNLPDAVWLSVLRSENVKRALHDSYLASKSAFVNDRLSMNVLSIAYIVSNLLYGQFFGTNICLFYKRNFDVEADWTLKSPALKDYPLNVRTEELRSTTYAALKTTFSREHGIESWEEIENCVHDLLWNCSAFEFKFKNSQVWSWSRVKGKIRKEFWGILPSSVTRKLSGLLILSGPDISSLILCRWFRWNFWLIIHNRPCCRAAYNFLREVTKD